MEYVLAVQKQFQVDVESAKEALTLSALPHAERSDRTRAVAEGDANESCLWTRCEWLEWESDTYEEDEDAIKGREMRSLRNSAASNRGHEDDHLEEAPLLLKD